MHETMDVFDCNEALKSVTGKQDHGWQDKNLCIETIISVVKKSLHIII